MPRKAGSKAKTGVRGIRRTASGTYIARYLGPDGRQHSRTFPTVKAAEAWRNDERRKARLGSWTDPARGRTTVGEWGEQWLTGHMVEPTTLAGYRVAWAKLIEPRWGNVQLSRVTQADVREWLATLRKGNGQPYSTSRLRLVFNVLCQMLDAAVEDGLIARNPARSATGRKARLVPPARTTKEHRYLSHQEVASLAEAMPPHYRTFVRVLAYTGLRWGEATALRARSYDELRGRLRVTEAAKELGSGLIYGPTKTHASREVVVPQMLRPALAELLAGKGPDDLLFTTERGEALRASNFRGRVWTPAVKAAHLGSLTPHDLRHTAASLAISAGAHVKAVQRMLGHADAAMTLNTYAGLFGDDLDGVAESLSSAATEAISGVNLQSVCSLPASAEAGGHAEGSANAV